VALPAHLFVCGWKVMNPLRPLVSIVCPAYQEEEVLPQFHYELCQVLGAHQDRFRFEVVYVDDGSRDGTLECLRHLAAGDPRIGFLSLSRNFGHQAALTAGLEFARGDAVISMDSDLQHPPGVVPDLLAKWQAGHDVVITIRAEDPGLSLFKRASSRLFYRAMAMVGAAEVRAAAADFRLLSRPALDAFLKLRERHRFVRSMIQWLGFPAAEILFKPDRRRAGKTKYTLRKMLRLAGDGLFSFSNGPLRLPLYAGLLVWLAGAVHVGGCLAYLLLGLGPIDPLTHYLLLLGHLTGGGVLIGLGTVGEYVGRVYDEVKKRPLYLVKETNLQPRPALSESPDQPQLTVRRDAA
jgi:polyisoprenyl-phosphate glycosyltransferase